MRLIEVKASTKVKPVNHIDCAVQAWVLDGAGLRPDRIELAHIDNRFVYPGGGDYEGRIANLDGFIADPGAPATVLSAPPPGKYRLFAYASDEQGHVAHANIPFLVRSARLDE